MCCYYLFEFAVIVLAAVNSSPNITLIFRVHKNNSLSTEADTCKRDIASSKPVGLSKMSVVERKFLEELNDNVDKINLPGPLYLSKVRNLFHSAKILTCIVHLY